MTLTGGCHCGALRYSVAGEPQHVSLCHCSDCRKNAGAPMVAWAGFSEEQLTVEQGELTTHNSSGAAMRSFCPRCGTGLFYRNAELLPGIVDVQSVTFDEPGAVPPQIHVQMAESIDWMAGQDQLPRFERYPPPE